MNVAYNMDCMEGMKQYPDKYFDLAVVDPPYGIDICSQTVQVEREREQGSEAEAHSAVRKTRIGGGKLSSPKATTRLMTKRHQMRNTFPKSNG